MLRSIDLSNQSNPPQLDSPEGNLLSKDASVFNGRSMFPDTVSAYRAALGEIYRDGGDVERGFELIPGPGGTIKLGKLVEGTANSVEASKSDHHSGQDWPIKLGGRGRTIYSMGHSHPETRSLDGRGLSIPDIQILFMSRPLGGFHSTGLIDMKSGQAYLVQFVAGTKIPDEVMFCLGGQRPETVTKFDTEFTASWFKKMFESGKFKVTLIGEFGALGAPSFFRFQYNGSRNTESSYMLHNADIRRALK